MLLVTQAQPQMRAHKHPNLGRLIQPRHYPAIEQTAAEGFSWAADNDCFNGGLDEEAFDRMLRRIRGLPGCLFVVAPDVVGDAEQTLGLWSAWVHRLDGLPRAFVGQDGLSLDDVPWQQMDAFFIGGSTEWKMSTDAARLAREAKRRGKWVHMGRVNSLSRIRYAASLGCDSVDGLKFAKWRNRYLDEALTDVSVGRQLGLGDA